MPYVWSVLGPVLELGVLPEDTTQLKAFAEKLVKPQAPISKSQSLIGDTRDRVNINGMCMGGHRKYQFK